mgnify:CR=1 FL=1
MSANRYIQDYPVIGIRPTIDGRRGVLGVRESLEDQTMNMAKAAARLFTENLKRSSTGLRQDGRGSQNRAYERCDERGASACQIFELIRVFLPSK